MHRSGVPSTDIDTSLVDSLTSPAAFAHPVTTLELIETHISWVILAGEFAYKIKKPIKLPFVDCRDLARRKFYCEEEIRLNQPWAPGIYLGVTPITMHRGQARFDGNGTPVEYAVRMRRFDQSLRLDQQLQNGELSVADMKELGRNIAARHVAAPVVAADQRERVITRTKDFIWDNFTALQGFLDDDAFTRLRVWMKAELQKLDVLLWQRFDAGHVRDCHGDLHLANLIRLPTGITTFDCIEFSTDLRHIDVACDIAFLLMDLVEKQRRDLAAHFLNRYLECTGDYDSVRVLNLYFVYRCMVRAKVAAIRSQERELDAEREADQLEIRQYVDIALRQIAQDMPALVVMTGLSGSGKSWVSGQLMAAMPAIRIRSDLERKRMLGMDENESGAAAIDSGIYSQDMTRRVYASLCATAGTILQAGHNVILDAACLHVADRDAALAVARACASSCIILQVTAPDRVLRERLRLRQVQRSDVSDAGLAVLEHQLATAEPLTPAEKRRAIHCENAGELQIDELVAQINESIELLEPTS